MFLPPLANIVHSMQLGFSWMSVGSPLVPLKKITGARQFICSRAERMGVAVLFSVSICLPGGVPMRVDLIKRYVSLAQLACSLLTGALACGEPLAPSSYRGEPIFRVQGNALSTSSSDDWQHLKAVLAFITDTQLVLNYSITVRPVDESGIGGDFQLELFDAPPASTMIDFEAHPEWGQIALALIAAVPKHHPPRLSRLHKEDFTELCDEAQACMCEPAEYQRTLDFSFGTEQSTYNEVLCCSDWGSADADCRIVSHSGDASLRDESILPVDAVVPSFTLFYIEQPAPAGSPLAEYLFHTKYDLDAGYHLIEATPKQVPDDTGDEYDFKVVGGEDVVLRFQRDVLPWGVNL